MKLVIVVIALNLTRIQSLSISQGHTEDFLSVFVHDDLVTNQIVDDGPPPHTEHARLARYIMHHSGTSGITEMVTS